MVNFLMVPQGHIHQYYFSIYDPRRGNIHEDICGNGGDTRTKPFGWSNNKTTQVYLCTSTRYKIPVQWLHQKYTPKGRSHTV